MIPEIVGFVDESRSSGKRETYLMSVAINWNCLENFLLQT
ncbi:unnamed protein product [Larinioides sclopetarius]|uniref:DUF4371 domain-containing protein n=1 Tax=Larinioides sclopetarius TaxID=280406 RepID=A0AAV2AT47_9ARAC